MTPNVIVGLVPTILFSAIDYRNKCGNDIDCKRVMIGNVIDPVKVSVIVGLVPTIAITK